MTDAQQLSPEPLTPLTKERLEAQLQAMMESDQARRRELAQALVDEAPKEALRLLQESVREWDWIKRQHSTIILRLLAVFWQQVTPADDLSQAQAKACILQLERLMRDDDYDVREAAVIGLANASPETFATKLPKAFNDDSTQVVKQVLMQVGALGLVAFLDQVKARLTDDDSDLRCAAILAMCGLGTEDARFSLLTEAATSEDWNDRSTAAQALAMYGTPGDKAQLALLEVLYTDDDTDVQGAALQAICQLSPEHAVPRAQEALIQRPYLLSPAFQTLRKLMSPEALIAWIEDRQLAFVGSSVREVYNWFGQRAVAQVPTVLMKIPQVVDAGARLAMAQWALDLEGWDAERADLYEACCQDPSGEVQAVALEGLWPTKTQPERLAMLIQAFRSESYQLRDTGLNLLKVVDDIDAFTALVPALEPLRHSDYSDISRGAIRALVQLQPDKRVVYLSDACKGDWMMRQMAMELCEAHGDEAAVPLIKDCLTDDDSDVRRAAMSAAIKIDPGNHHNLLQVMSEHSSWDVRRDAMHALGTNPDLRILPLVLKGLTDDDSDVRQAAMEAGCSLIEHHPATLAQIGPIALQDESWSVRREIAAVFALHGTADMLPLIEPLLQDYDSDVVQHAFTAVMKLATPTQKLPLAILACAKGEYIVGDEALDVLQEWEDGDALVQGIQAVFVELVGDHASRLLDVVSAHEAHAEFPPARSALPGLLATIPAVKDADARASLASFVTNYPGDEQLPLLQRFWGDPDGKVRCQGYLGLRKWCPDEATALSVEALASDHVALQIHALSYLADLADTSHRPLFEEALLGYQYEVSHKAFEVMCQVFPEERRALALQHRGHDNWYVRQAAAYQLGAPGGVGERSDFEQLFRDSVPEVRKAAYAAALSVVPAAEMMPDIVDAWCDIDEELREIAAGVINEWTDQDTLIELAIARIPQLLEDSDPAPLFELIAEHAPQRLLEVLPHIDQIDDSEVQQELLAKCLDSGVDIPIPMMRDMLEKGASTDLRRDVYERLCERLPGEKLLFAAKLLEDDEWSMRQFGLEAIAKEENPDPSLLTDILPMARDHDYDVRMAALRTIAKFNDARAYSEMVAALDDENEAVRNVAKECLASGPEEMPILKRFAHLQGDEPIWIRMRRQLGEVHEWVQEIGFELLGRSILITQPGHKNADDQGESARKGLIEIVLPDTPITQLHANGEEVMRALALYKLGHFLYNEGTRGYKTMRGIAKSEGIVEVYDLLAFERVERNLRARRDAWGPLLDRLTSYAFAKTIYRVPIAQYADLVAASPEETLERVSSGALPGQLLPSKRPGQHIVSLRDRDLLLIPNALPPLMAFVWCLRCGYEAKLHPNPVVAEAIALLPGSLKGMAHAKVLQLARDIAALLGSSDDHKQQFQDMMDKLMGKEGQKGQGSQEGQGGQRQGGQGGSPGAEGGAPGGAGGARPGGPGRSLRPSALHTMMRQHLQRLSQAGGTPEWMSPEAAPKTGQHAGRVRKHRQVIYRRQEQRGSKAAGGQAINLGKDLDFDLLKEEQVLGYSATTHAEIVGPIRKHIRRLRSYFERLGRTSQDEYASRRGSRLDVAQARRLLYTTTANLLVHSYEEIQADLYLGILIDRSGSMDGEKLRVAKSFGTLVAESARSIRGIEGHVNAFDDDTFFYMGDFQRSGIAQLEAGGGNNDAGGLHRAAQLAMASRKKNRLLIMISDGSPTECTVDALRNFVQRLDRDYQIRCAQVAVESLSDITFPHHVDLSQYPLDEAVSRFGKLLIKLTASWR